jgi:hypothetical protein
MLSQQDETSVSLSPSPAAPSGALSLGRLLRPGGSGDACYFGP